MIAPDWLVRDVLRAADGEIVGRIRLQKIIYLLEQKGLGSNVAFQYYHYGPYSRMIDDAIERGKALAGITEEIRYRRSDGAQFSVFRVDQGAHQEKTGRLNSSTVHDFIKVMKDCSATVIELAATIHWLAFHEKVGDWRRELVRRKGAKTESGRAEQAEELLRVLHLAPS